MKTSLFLSYCIQQPLGQIICLKWRVTFIVVRWRTQRKHKVTYKNNNKEKPNYPRKSQNDHKEKQNYHREKQNENKTQQKVNKYQKAAHSKLLRDTIRLSREEKQHQKETLILPVLWGTHINISEYIFYPDLSQRKSKRGKKLRTKL